MDLKYILMFISVISTVFANSTNHEKLLVLSIATEPTDGFKRFEKSLKAYDYDYKIYGMGEEWRGGNIKLEAGGGQKINILKRHLLELIESNEDLVVIFTDSYDVIVNQEPDKVFEKFRKFGARIIFSAEDFCWPNPDLADEFPKVGAEEKRFLNSGGIIGYAKELNEIVNIKEIQDNDDDQLYYTSIFLDVSLREKHGIKLDTKSEIFQNMNGALDEIALEPNGENYIVYNKLTKSYPAFLHGNGPVKLILNRVGNYIGKAYSLDGCQICLENVIELDDQESEWPNVTIGIFIESPTPFLKEFFQKISNLNYPKSKITLLIHNAVKYHVKTVENFFVEPDNEYLSIKYISPDDKYSEAEARTEAIEECMKTNCNYYFALSSTAHFTNKETLKILIRQNRGVLAPVIRIAGTTWTNVWGDISENGFYKRSEDYLNIIERDNLGVWNMPYVAEAVLIKGELLAKVGVIYEHETYDSSMVFAQNLRDNNIFMFATNVENFGYLIDTDNYNTSLVRPEMFEMVANFEAWKERYIHKEYIDYLNNVTKIPEPCNDVFWFPVVSDKFCEDLIVMMEDYGQWSGGRNNYNDERLPGGVENVPTVDIHMRQIGWDTQWHYFLKQVIMPMQQTIFPGYFSDPPSALLSFVVRYRPGEQDALRPHNDASTYTINIALNQPDVEFEGGGCRFVRRNCSVTKTKKGWAFMHPGRLTHLHEGLKVTKGTRYIMVTFVDP